MGRAAGALLVAVVIAGAGAPACVTTAEGEKMRADIADLRAKLDQIDKRDKEYKEQVAKLRVVLDQATKLLTRNSADVGAKAAKAEQDIAALQGRIEELSHTIDQQSRTTADSQNRLETRLAALEQTQNKIVDKVAPTMPDDKEQVVRLRTVLDQATKLLTRNSADVGAKAAKAEQHIAALQGRLEEMSHAIELANRQATDERTRLDARVAAMEATQSKIVDKVAPAMHEDKDQLWQQAAQRLASGQRDDGRRFYRVFIQRFPQDPRAPQAYLAIGMSFVQEGKHPNAANEFRNVLTNYASSPEVPEAMWQLSLAFVQLKWCTDAKAQRTDLAKRYPKSPRANDAKGELKTIAKLPKNSCTS